MAYGLKILNNAGFTQIDEEYSNYYTVASGIGSDSVEFYYPDYGVVPVIMGRPLTVGAAITRHWILPERAKIGCSSGFAYKVMIPMRLVQPSATAYGLRVYNSSGGLNFDSGHIDQLKVTGASNWYWSNYPGEDFNITCSASTGNQYICINPLGMIGRGSILGGPYGGWAYCSQTGVNSFFVEIQNGWADSNASYTRGDWPLNLFFGAFL